MLSMAAAKSQIANGSPISGYVITVQPGGTSIVCSASPCEVTGLRNGVAYGFTVRATNAVGDSTESAASVAAPAGPPAPAGKATATMSGTTATITWVAPAALNGATITGYTVTASPGGAACTVTDPAATSCTIEGLDPSVTYSFAVVAHSTAGDSAVTTTEAASSTPHEATPSTTHGLAFTGAGLAGSFGLAFVLVVSGVVMIAEERRRSRCQRHM